MGTKKEKITFEEVFHYTQENKINNCFNCLHGGDHYIGGCVCHEKQDQKAPMKVVDPDGKCDLWKFSDLPKGDFTHIKGEEKKNGRS